MLTFEKINDALKDAQMRLAQIYAEFNRIQMQQLDDVTHQQVFARQVRNGLLAERAALLRLGLAISQGDR